MSRNWSEREVTLLVADYLTMLKAELMEEPFNKADHVRMLSPLLRDRTKGSIERKHQNVSAILIELGQPWVQGNAPLSNYQEILFEAVIDAVQADPALVQAIRSSVQAQASPSSVMDLLDRWEDPPEPSAPMSYAVRERPHRSRQGVNWLEVEARNHSLGLAGEQFVMTFEQARLRQAGKDKLADRVEHVAVTLGDGEGFDVRSYEVDGSDRLIEVKTTAYGKQTPFFLSRNELRASQSKSHAYHLYRLFRFRQDPRVYGLRGALDQSCYLDPVQFAARVK